MSFTFLSDALIECRAEDKRTEQIQFVSDRVPELVTRGTVNGNVVLVGRRLFEIRTSLFLVAGYLGASRTEHWANVIIPIIYEQVN